jgi:chromosome segregation ATPase
MLAVLTLSAMPATAASRKPPAEIDKTAARRFPLVHKLIHFADLRHFYRDMREALITANRRAGAQQGLVTKAKKKIAELEAELSVLEKERADLLAYRQQVEQEANQISALLPRLKGRLLQVQQIEQALANLADVKEAVEQQERAYGGPSRQSNEDLHRAIERLLERADAVEFFEETVEDIESEIESDLASGSVSSPDFRTESDQASDER